MSEELSGCSYCEAGKHDECVNAMCDCSHRKSCGKTIREWQEICYRHNTVVINNNRLRASLLAAQGEAERMREALDTIAVLTQNDANPRICRIALAALSRRPAEPEGKPCDGPYCPTFPHSHEVECPPGPKPTEKPQREGL